MEERYMVFASTPRSSLTSDEDLVVETTAKHPPENHSQDSKQLNLPSYLEGTEIPNPSSSTVPATSNIITSSTVANPGQAASTTATSSKPPRPRSPISKNFSAAQIGSPILAPEPMLVGSYVSNGEDTTTAFSSITAPAFPFIPINNRSSEGRRVKSPDRFTPAHDFEDDE